MNTPIKRTASKPPVASGSRLLPEDYIQMVLQNTDIVAVIGEHVQLKKTGPENVGRCPFHEEKSGSFFVNSSKGAYNCQGCGKKGNAITFLKDHQGMSFNDAIEALAIRANLPKPSSVRPSSNRPDENAGEYRQLMEIVERAKKLYQQELYKNKQALDYLYSRGVNDDMIKKFQIGYAPGGWRFLLDGMKDVPVPMLMKAGLVTKKEHDDNRVSHFDIMRERIMFPIQNLSGHTLGFGGRVLDENSKRKYINTPDTLIFHKRNELYGWHEARQAIAKERCAIVTEGYVDSVIPSGHGVNNIVSAMGATMQTNTISRLLKTAQHIVYCFDGDNAGMMAAQKTLEQSISLVDAKHTVSFAFLPEKYDPDDYVLEFGADGFRDLCYKNAMPMSEFLLKDTASRCDLESIEGRARFATDAMALVNLMQPGFMKEALSTEVRKRAKFDDLPELVRGQVTKEAAEEKPLTSTAPPRSIFNRNRGAQKPQALAPVPVNEQPTLSLRMIGMLINDLDAAKLFNPKWAIYDNTAKAGEVECIQAIVSVANDEKSPVKNMAELLDRLKGTDAENTIERACRLQDSKLANDPIEELSKLATYLVQCKQREMKRQALFSPKP